VKEGHNEPLESSDLLHKYDSLLHYIELIEVWSVDQKRSVMDDNGWWCWSSPGQLRCPTQIPCVKSANAESGPTKTTNLIGLQCGDARQ